MRRMGDKVPAWTLEVDGVRQTTYYNEDAAYRAQSRKPGSVVVKIDARTGLPL